MKNWQIEIPNEDRFVPFSLTINKGDTITWTNNDSDDHTVVSDTAVNKINPKVNVTIESGKSITLKFKEVGQWIYYCRFHSHIDEYGQPVAPGCGPEGNEISGIMSNFQCKNAAIMNNFGTPMMGIITILPKKKH